MAGVSYRRQNDVLKYMLRQPGHASGSGSYDTAVHVVQDLGLYVSDRRANEYWAAIFDLTQAGTIVEVPGTGIRLATPEEMKAKLSEGAL